MYISHSVHAEVPPEKIWDAFMEIESWPAFTSQFKSIVRLDEGALAEGKRARVTPRGFMGSVWTITQFEEGRSFAWTTDPLPGVHLAADHIIEPDGKGANLTLSLESSGPLAPFLMTALGLILRRDMLQAPVLQLSEGINAYCEAG